MKNLFTIVAIHLFFNTLMYACNQKLAKQLFIEALNSQSYEQQIRRLNRALENCYSPNISAYKYLLEGDHFFNLKNYERAKEFYNKSSKEIGYIENPKDRQQLQKYYYEGLIGVYKKQNRLDLVNDIQAKLRQLNRTVKNFNKIKFLDANIIYNQLKPSKFEGKGVGIIAKEIILHIEFEQNSAKLKGMGKKQAVELKKALQKLINEYKNSYISILGYTNTDGKASYNQRLSERRADTIKKFLIINSLIEISKISIQGLGEKEPICIGGTPSSNLNGEYFCSNDKEDKAAGRRVKIIFKAK